MISMRYHTHTGGSTFSEKYALNSKSGLVSAILLGFRTQEVQALKTVLLQAIPKPPTYS